MRKLGLLLAVSLALAGCESTGPKQGVGSVIGAAGGGLLGASLAPVRGSLRRSRWVRLAVPCWVVTSDRVLMMSTA